ncbi:MAG: RNA methyltransferase [Chloroflexota bacterium]
MDELISSRSNPLVRQVRQLRTRKGRSEAGLFLAEGIHHVGEAVEAGWTIEALLYAPDLLKGDFANRLVDGQTRQGVRVAALTGELFSSLADKDNPQGLLAILRPRTWTLNHLTGEKIHFGVAIVGAQDPGNVGAILRTVDAVGADALFLLDGGVDPYHPSVVRASMGTIFWKPVLQIPFTEFHVWSHDQGFQLAGTSAHATMDYRAYQRGGAALILVLGSEQKGLSPEQAAACDIVISLPMRGRASSLNLAVAAGILLYSLGE